MKVLLLNGSPHKDGTTFASLREAELTLQKEGIETELIHIGGMKIQGCNGCLGCRKIGKCVQNDGLNEVAKKFEQADGIIVGTPVYYASPNGTIISFLDRLFYSTRFNKSMKVGAGVVCARRGGCTASFDVLNKYFLISGMPVAPSSYWNQVHGASSAEEAAMDEEGMQTMRNLARNMSFLIKSIAMGKETLGMPEKENTARTNFIR